MHFIDKEDIVTYVDFDCGITFLPETPTKIRQINRERNYISRSCEKPQWFPSNDQHICSVDEQHSSNISLNPCNLWNMAPAAFISLNHTNDTYSMSSSLNQQLTNLEQTHNRRFLHCERWTVKGRACASALHSFKKLLTRRTSERNSCYGWRTE